jgi:hypothetical protein
VAKLRDGVALDRRRHDGGQKLPVSELRACGSSIQVLPNELNTPLTPDSMIRRDACFAYFPAYFNKIWGIPCETCFIVEQTDSIVFSDQTS